MSAEHFGVWPGCIGEGLRGHGGSLAFSEWKAGFEDGGPGSQCRADWEDFPERGPSQLGVDLERTKQKGVFPDQQGMMETN
jgi:hypothetical protein